MNIMVMADHESKSLYDYYDPGKLEGIDLIISCGDLDADYLSFFATLCHVPVIYVRGNHDRRYEVKPPEGCICIEDDIFVYKGVRILGLGGSMRYKNDDWQYTEEQMRSRIRKMWYPLWREKGFDILLTHAPAKGIHDGTDLPHMGFEVFKKLMDKYNPGYFIHGHVHMNYGRDHVREDLYKSTRVINAFERYIIEIPD